MMKMKRVLCSFAFSMMVFTSAVEASCEKIKVSGASRMVNGIYKLTTETASLKESVWKHEERDRLIMVSNPSSSNGGLVGWVITDSNFGEWEFARKGIQLSQDANPWDLEWSSEIIVTCIGGSNVSTDCKCGVANSRTVRRRVLCESGDCDSNKNEFPWMVMLEMHEVGAACGGSIISKKEILTAAHCVNNLNPLKLSVKVGDHNRVRADGEKKYSVCSKVQHPEFNEAIADNDFAIVTLCDEITFNENVSPICLPNTAGREASLNEGRLATVTGWGAGYNGKQNYVLQKAKVQTISNKKCNEANFEGHTYKDGITDNMICAEDPADYKDKNTCFGDSGGPLAVQEGNSFVQIGIVTWGYGGNKDGLCVKVGLPAVYARVTAQLDWVKSNMAYSTCPRAHIHETFSF